jgi:DNA-binding NarL/FixJ family response regulator
MDSSPAVPGQIRILIADDHLIVRVGLATLLNKEKDLVVVDSVASGSEALSFFQTQTVDVVLLDLRMANGGGLEILPNLLGCTNAPKVLIITSFEYEEEIYKAAKAGAHGYLTKEATRAEIVEAIRSVHRGQLHFHDSIASRIVDRASRASLSPRELGVMAMMAKGLTNKEIAHVLQISQFTVRNHVIHILGKLEASDRTEAVSIALQQGILGGTV